MACLSQPEAPPFQTVPTRSGTALILGRTRTLALLGGDALAEAAANRSAIIEFRVGDVDGEHTGLTPIIGSEMRREWGVSSVRCEAALLPKARWLFSEAVCYRALPPSVERPG
jgi:hypothetical protein